MHRNKTRFQICGEARCKNILFRNSFVTLGLSILVLCTAIFLLNGTARAALERGTANNEIDRPKSLCICARHQRPIVEPSFCEMRSWLVFRSRRESLHSKRLWQLKSSSAMERQPAAGCASRRQQWSGDLQYGPPYKDGAVVSIVLQADEQHRAIVRRCEVDCEPPACPRRSYWMRRGVCFQISVCDRLSNPT